MNSQLTSLVVSITLVGKVTQYFTDLPEDVILYSLIGASVYVFINKTLSPLKQILFFALSFMLGTTELNLIAAKIFTKYLSSVDAEIIVSRSTGALIVSACGISLLLVVASILEKYTNKKHSELTKGNNIGTYDE